MSFPATAIGTLGIWALVIIISLWIILTICVFKMTLIPYSKYDYADRENRTKENNQLTTFGILRLIALSYFLGSGIWLLLSYYNIVPFTGRILFGLGQDSVGEILETMILFITFGLIYNKKDKYEK